MIVLFRYRQLVLFIMGIALMTYLTIPTRTEMGMIYFNSYNYEKALEYLSESRSVEEGNVLALKKIKEYFVIQGDTLKALDVAKKLYHFRPHNIEFIKDVEKLCDWNNLPEERLYYQEKRAELLKNTEEREMMLLDIANSYRYLKVFDKAERVFEKIKNSKIKVIGDAIIQYYLVTGQAQKAVQKITEYEKIFGENDTYNVFFISNISLVEGI